MKETKSSKENHCPVPEGTLMLIGGKENKGEEKPENKELPSDFVRLQVLEAFIRHRREVVTRRTIFELRKARARAHVLEGLTVALANIDEMIELIKTSENPQVARERMLARTWQPGLVGSLLAAAGDMVKPGEAIATVGTSGGQNTPALYFGIRQQGRPTDPAQWCRAQG